MPSIAPVPALDRGYLPHRSQAWLHVLRSLTASAAGASAPVEAYRPDASLLPRRDYRQAMTEHRGEGARGPASEDPRSASTRFGRIFRRRLSATAAAAESRWVVTPSVVLEAGHPSTSGSVPAQRTTAASPNPRPSTAETAKGAVDVHPDVVLRLTLRRGPCTSQHRQRRHPARWREGTQLDPRPSPSVPSKIAATLASGRLGGAINIDNLLRNRLSPHVEPAEWRGGGYFKAGIWRTKASLGFAAVPSGRSAFGGGFTPPGPGAIELQLQSMAGP